MAKAFYLHFLIRDHKDLTFEVRESESTRISSLLDNATGGSTGSTFIWFETIDGKSIVINCRFIQAIRYLWEAAALPPGLIRDDRTEVFILLHGRTEPLEEVADSPIQIVDIYTNLERLGGHRLSGIR